MRVVECDLGLKHLFSFHTKAFAPRYNASLVDPSPDTTLCSLSLSLLIPFSLHPLSFSPPCGTVPITQLADSQRNENKGEIYGGLLGEGSIKYTEAVVRQKIRNRNRNKKKNR